MNTRTLTGLFRAIRANLRTSQADRAIAYLHSGTFLETALTAAEAGPVAFEKLKLWVRWYDSK